MIFLYTYFFIALLFTLFYVYIMLRYRIGWQKVPHWILPKDFQPKTFCSIIIPARNEEKHILTCVKSILAQNYPNNLFEIIVVDDHSTDQTANLVLRLKNDNIKLLHLVDHLQKDETQSFKKKGIQIAIQQAKGELIVTTDADCWMGEEWLSLMVSFYEGENAKFIAAPVNFTHEKSLIEKFQSLDFVGMMSITGAGIQGGFQHMCNGANLAYAKSAFEAVDGFSGIDHLASGDDMMLMQKIAHRYPDQIGFMKNQEATVFTTAKPTWESFLNQRIRWASKSADYKEWKVTFILAMVFFFCVSLLLSLLLIPIYGLPMLCFFLFQLSLKAVMDYQLLKPMAKYFYRNDLMKSFVPSVFLHWFYIVIVGTMANFKKEYEWKGRRVR